MGIARRARLAGIFAAAAVLVTVSCGSRANNHPNIAGQHSGPAAATPTHGTPAPIELSTESLPQGGAFSVRLRAPNVVAAATHFNNRNYPMVSNAGLWFTIVGAGQPIGSVAMIPTGSLPVTVTYQLKGSRDTYTSKAAVMVTPTNFPVDAIVVGQGEEGLLAPDLEASETETLTAAYSGFTPMQYWRGRFSPPVRGSVTTTFGARRSYQGGPVSGSHAGVDIGVRLATPVVADANGRVVWTGELADRGEGVILDHGLGVFSGYFHLSKIIAQVGDRVQQGDTVGLAGSTGLSTGPHVHWEIVVNGVNIDALQWDHLDMP